MSGEVRRVTQAALVVPGDVAADGNAVRRVSRALDRLGRPDLEPAEQFVAWRQRAVLDKQATDVGLRLLSCGDLVKQFVRELVGRGQGAQSLFDVRLSDRGNSAVRPSHLLERAGQRHQLIGDRARLGIGQQLVDQVAERAAPASAFHLEGPPRQLQDPFAGS